MSAEFDTVASWTAEVAVDLGAEFYVAAGCRGSGSPLALSWLVTNLGLTATDRMLDVGAGVGGPAAYARDEVGTRPVLAEPEAGACRAAARLFGLQVIRADAQALPFATGAFDVAWSLGVLCTTDDHAAVLAEMHRVLTPGARLGLLLFTATTAHLPDQPDGNNFPRSDEVPALLDAAGFRITAAEPISDFGREPDEWRRRGELIESELERRHHGHNAWRTALEQSSAFGELLKSGRVEGSVLVVCRD
jgi:SAM-dependent methyltransferase